MNFNLFDRIDPDSVSQLILMQPTANRPGGLEYLDCRTKVPGKIYCNVYGTISAYSVFDKRAKKGFIKYGVLDKNYPENRYLIRTYNVLFLYFPSLKSFGLLPLDLMRYGWVTLLSPGMFRLDVLRYTHRSYVWNAIKLKPINKRPSLKPIEYLL